MKPPNREMPISIIQQKTPANMSKSKYPQLIANHSKINWRSKQKKTNIKGKFQFKALETNSTKISYMVQRKKKYFREKQFQGNFTIRKLVPRNDHSQSLSRKIQYKDKKQYEEKKEDEGFHMESHSHHRYRTTFFPQLSCKNQNKSKDHKSLRKSLKLPRQKLYQSNDRQQKISGDLERQQQCYRSLQIMKSINLTLNTQQDNQQDRRYGTINKFKELNKFLDLESRKKPSEKRIRKKYSGLDEKQDSDDNCPNRRQCVNLVGLEVVSINPSLKMNRDIVKYNLQNNKSLKKMNQIKIVNVKGRKDVLEQRLIVSDRVEGWENQSTMEKFYDQLED